MSDPPRKYLLVALQNAALAWCGVIICLVLVFRKQAEFCANGADCESVLNSSYAKVGGIPLSEIGLAVYIVLFSAFLALSAAQNEQIQNWLLRITMLGTTLSAIASGWLVYLQLFVIHGFCTLCTASAMVMFALAALTFRLKHAEREAAPATVFFTVGFCLALATGMIVWMLRPPPPTKLASVDGIGITEAEIPTAARLKLHPLETDLYYQKLAWMESKIDDLVLQSEARKKGVSVASLMEEQKRNESRADYLKGLRTGHKINVFLHPPLAPLINIDLATAEIDGPRDAPIQLVVFSDFQCPYCARLAPILKRARAEHPRDVMVAFRYFPLESHPRARAAAVAAACASTFGKFWEYHDFLFAHQDDFPDAELISAGRAMGIDEHSFSQCLAIAGVAAKVDASYNDALKIGLDTAPSLFLNGALIGGVPRYDDLNAMIREKLIELHAPTGASPSAGGDATTKPAVP